MCLLALVVVASVDVVVRVATGEYPRDKWQLYIVTTNALRTHSDTTTSVHRPKEPTHNARFLNTQRIHSLFCRFVPSAQSFAQGVTEIPPCPTRLQWLSDLRTNTHTYPPQAIQNAGRRNGKRWQGQLLQHDAVCGRRTRDRRTGQSASERPR